MLILGQCDINQVKMFTASYIMILLLLGDSYINHSNIITST